MQESQKINQIMIKTTKVKIRNLSKKKKMEKLNRKNLMIMVQAKIKLLSSLKEKMRNQRKNEFKIYVERVCCVNMIYLRNK